MYISIALLTDNGYIFFAVGFSILATNSTFFLKARNFNYVKRLIEIGISFCYCSWPEYLPLS